MGYELNKEKERGCILLILDCTYPDPMDQETIKKQLTDLKFLTCEAGIRSNIAFLEEQELICCETVGVGRLSRRVAKLTYKGKNLVDGNAPPVVGVDI